MTAAAVRPPVAASPLARRAPRHGLHCGPPRTDPHPARRLAAAQANNEIETVAGAFLQTALVPWRLAKAARGLLVGATGEPTTRDLHVLHKVSGVLKPGTVTLLLAPPGAGKTTFLKAITGRLAASKLQGRCGAAQAVGAHTWRRARTGRQWCCDCVVLALACPP